MDSIDCIYIRSRLVHDEVIVWCELTGKVCDMEYFGICEEYDRMKGEGEDECEEIVQND